MRIFTGAADAGATISDRIAAMTRCRWSSNCRRPHRPAQRPGPEARRLSASRNLWVVRLFTGRPIQFPLPEEALDYPYTEQEQRLLAGIEARSIVGAPDVVKERLTTLAERHGAEELVVVTITYDFASRLRSYELLADAFALSL